MRNKTFVNYFTFAAYTIEYISSRQPQQMLLQNFPSHCTNLQSWMSVFHRGGGGKRSGKRGGWWLSGVQLHCSVQATQRCRPCHMASRLGESKQVFINVSNANKQQCALFCSALPLWFIVMWCITEWIWGYWVIPMTAESNGKWDTPGYRQQGNSALVEEHGQAQIIHWWYSPVGLLHLQTKIKIVSW